VQILAKTKRTLERPLPLFAVATQPGTISSATMSPCAPRGIRTLTLICFVGLWMPELSMIAVGTATFPPLSSATYALCPVPMRLILPERHSPSSELDLRTGTGGGAFLLTGGGMCGRASLIAEEAAAVGACAKFVEARTPAEGLLERAPASSGSGTEMPAISTKRFTRGPSGWDSRTKRTKYPLLTFMPRSFILLNQTSLRLPSVMKPKPCWPLNQSTWASSMISSSLIDPSKGAVPNSSHRNNTAVKIHYQALGDSIYKNAGALCGIKVLPRVRKRTRGLSFISAGARSRAAR
jgi:hypothetical protein